MSWFQVLDFHSQEFMAISSWRDLASREGAWQSTVFVADRASANGTAIAGWHGEPETEIPTLRFPCYVHIADTTQARTCCTLSGDISALIALSCFMESTGQSIAFREAIEKTLIANLSCVHDSAPPGPDAPSSRHRENVLALLLPPDSPANRARAHVLRTSLTGDWTSKRIELHRVGGWRGFNLQQWAVDLAKALLPRAIRPFPRQRWMQSLHTVTEYSLLGCAHHLLPVAGLRWLGPGGQKQTTTGRRAQAISRPL